MREILREIASATHIRRETQATNIGRKTLESIGSKKIVAKSVVRG
jgi:hypothetical protein